MSRLAPVPAVCPTCPPSAHPVMPEAASILAARLAVHSLCALGAEGARRRRAARLARLAFRAGTVVGWLRRRTAPAAHAVMAAAGVAMAARIGDPVAWALSGVLVILTGVSYRLLGE